MTTLVCLATVAPILEAVAVFVSVVLIVCQLAQANSLARASNDSAIVGLASSHYQVMLNPETAKLWVKGMDSPSKLSAIERERFRSLLIWWLLVHENISIQNRKRLIDSDVYRSWELDLARLANEAGLQQMWPSLKECYQSYFVDRLENLISEAKAK